MNGDPPGEGGIGPDEAQRRRWSGRLTSLPMQAAALAALAALALPLGVPAAKAAPDPGKVVRLAFDTAESGFDPVRISDGNSATIVEAIFERAC